MIPQPRRNPLSICGSGYFSEQREIKSLCSEKGAGCECFSQVVFAVSGLADRGRLGAPASQVYAFGEKDLPSAWI